ncbi:MAG: hypothetical protein AAF829_05320 [Pseudomonadota bacterium]
MRKSILVFMALGLAACGASLEDATPDTAAEASVPVSDLLDSAYVLTMSEAVLENASHPETLTVELDDRSVITIGGRPSQTASYGRTSGFGIQVPVEIESEASGQRVEVAVVLKSSRAVPVDVQAAYSTNEVGNSGWQALQAGSDWAIATFQYDVPELVNGLGDFVGLQSATGDSFEIAAIGFDIIPVEVAVSDVDTDTGDNVPGEPN